MLPVRTKVNTPGFCPRSKARATVAVTVTVGRPFVAEKFATAKTRRPSGHWASTSSHCAPTRTGANVNELPKAGS